ncbi:MAG: hypothetical protein HBSAPP03_04910 [Phycisphaerae bacterium]|nr:MAG: hypothetical protein HBSAPP03_04910 [Phycisphaerae bacterium]
MLIRVFVAAALAASVLPACAPKRSPAPLHQGPRTSTTARTIDKIRILRAGGVNDRVAFSVAHTPAWKYQAAFGGTDAGLDLAHGSDIYLDEGWVYVQGVFGGASILRVPIVITQVIDISAEGTAFLVHRATNALDERITVACAEGKVSVKDRINSKTRLFTVEAPNYAVYKWNGQAVAEIETGTIASNAMIRELIAKGKLFADDVKPTDTTSP